MSRKPAEWIKDGALVWYEPSPGNFFAGVVDGEPKHLGGHTWCVHLREMEPGYRDGRGSVTAAACDRLQPRAPAPSGEPVALTRGERAELLAWRAMVDAEGCKVSGRAGDEWLRAADLRDQNEAASPPAGRAAAEPPSGYPTVRELAAWGDRSPLTDDLLEHLRLAEAHDFESVISRRKYIELLESIVGLRAEIARMRAAAAEAPDMVAVRREDLKHRMSLADCGDFDGPDCDHCLRLSAALVKERA